ncbi:MAG TPA: cellulose binding domain-containing protein [Kineosporiaceae bacterium]|nr:cellulose binding domain-containing protein [Kineosporiaceae bacterium]
MGGRRIVGRRKALWTGLLVALGAVLAVTSVSSPGRALEVGGTSAPVTGSATWFDALGSPYGGCGLPQDQLDSPHFVALNVFNTPGDYGNYTRPLAGADLGKRGMWDNGHNCGRWVKVTISDHCSGVNDGAPGQPFCRNGSWAADAYNGATLNMLVADSCGDANAWCRDDPYHLDLAHASLNQFLRNGAPVGDLDPAHWGNRHISWQFTTAPDYTGDLKIGFLSGAQPYWGAIAVSHLPNGIHGVEYQSGGSWHAAKMNGDMGQAYVVEPTAKAGRDFRIRVTDAADALVFGGREYSFALPAGCSPQCGPAYTPVTYTASAGSSPVPTTTTVPPSPTTTTASAAPTTTTVSAVPSTTVSAVPSTTTVPPSPTTTASPPASGPACTARYQTMASWRGGYYGVVIVTAVGSPVHGWRVHWPMAQGQRLIATWNGRLTISNSMLTAGNATWNGSLPVGGQAVLGFIGVGSASSPGVTCAAT